MWNRGQEARRVSIRSIPGRPLEREHPRKRVFTSAKAPGVGESPERWRVWQLMRMGLLGTGRIWGEDSRLSLG